MPPPPPPAAASGRRSILSFAAARDRCFSRRFLRAGLRPLAIPLPTGVGGGDDAGTTVHVWVPANPPRNPLLLLHGFGASATWQWAPYLRPLIAAGFDPIVPDLLFFGASCTRLADRSDAFQARSIKAAMDAIGVARFGLVGVSYGGFVGYRMAAMYPDAVERVVLVCAGVCLEEKDLAAGLFPVAGVGEAAELLVPRRPEEVRRLVRLTFVRPPCIMPSCFLWDYIKVMGSDYIQEKTELLYALISERQLSNLPIISQPTLIVWGERDRVFPMELAHRLKRHLGEHSRLVVIRNAGHAVNLEKPKDVCRNIIEFFQERVTEALNDEKAETSKPLN
uniref:AB hydrolase-1 domain-containing protein n=1 Tax=Oryza punctata TaxID=4537 RepID=A0A0E0LNI4_ORYPU